MVDEKITIQDASEVDPNLLRMLDRGLEDIEAGRTLPHDEAMAEVRRIREARRFSRSNTDIDKESILKSEAPKLAKWYSVVALLGMSAKEVGKGAKSDDELRENLNNALLDGYCNTDEMKKELDNALDILKKAIADNTIMDEEQLMQICGEVG